MNNRGKMNKLSTQKGIGLLEIMLVFAVIAVIAITSIRYYSSAQQSQKVNQAVDQFGEVKGAFENYLTDHNNDPGNVKDYQIYNLVQQGYLPDAYGQTKNAANQSNPYGGSITLLAVLGKLTISMDGIPQGTCDPIVNRLKSTMNQSLGERASATTKKDKSGNEKGCNVIATYVM